MQKITTNIGSYKVTSFGFKSDACDVRGSMNTHYGKREWMPLTRVWTVAPAQGSTKTGCTLIAMAYAVGQHQSDSEDVNLWKGHETVRMYS